MPAGLKEMEAPNSILFDRIKKTPDEGIRPAFLKSLQLFVYPDYGTALVS